MSSWNAMTPDGSANLLRVVRHEAHSFIRLAARDGAWETPTACPGWQVRDVVGHLVDTTEAYFVAFDAARSHRDVDPAYGLRGMAARVDERATAFRDTPREQLLERLESDLDKMSEIFQALGPDDWAGLQVPHFYMGPLPAFFYPAFQLMDYAVHSWDIRQGTGRAHGLSGEAADLLVPFMFVLWQATTAPEPGLAPCDIGVRVTSGPNAGDTAVHVGPEGLTYRPGSLDDAAAVLEFDPGSFVLTAFGRCNAGTIRGDAAAADRYLNVFFRI
jgi:uncharacterized protein (TIGR03083 family)